ncbi:MAG: hypothetical protein GY716_18535 [bacterium]|nr:hypothetical protein [bacterium]
MRKERVVSSVIRIAALSVVLAMPAAAEVSVYPTGPEQVGTIIMAIGDHPDPVGLNAWKLFRPAGAQLALNPGGFERGDGTPDLVTHVDTGRPFVVWAYNWGTEHDVAFSEWTGSEWSFPRFLTETAEDEMDPRIALDPGDQAHVAWWIQNAQNSDSTVFVSMRQTDDSDWSPPIPVTLPGEDGRRPSIAVHDGHVLVAYERDSFLPELEQEVIVARWTGDGNWDVTVIAGTTRTERLDPILHSRGPNLWLDWKHENGEFGRAVAEGMDWGEWSVEAWHDPSWVGVEDQRKKIQAEVVP